MVWSRSFRRAAAAGEELNSDVVDQLLKVLSAGASSMSYGAPLCVAVSAFDEPHSLCSERPAVCSFHHHAGVLLLGALLVRGLRGTSTPVPCTQWF